MRDPEEVRRAIAKLHADAQAPAPPEPLEVPEIPKTPLPGQDLLQPAHATESTPLPPGQPPFSFSPKKSLAERLFTPENVRILQSLGIGLIFISAAAYVRTRMWENASPWGQLGFLLGGTAFCAALGFALRRWTALRLTGLGFLILGHLALVLDTYAALLPSTGGLQTLYPFAPASLWTFSLLLFTASAFWHARRLREPLFDAFTLFGGLAAWGSGMVWAGVDPWLLPASFLPALAACGLVSGWLKRQALRKGTSEAEARGTGEREDLPCAALRRWSLHWWLESAWSLGSALLTFILPLAAVLSGRAELAANFAWHAAAITGLGLGLVASALQGRSKAFVNLGALALFLPAPLSLYAFHGPWQHFSLALALPGLLVTLAAVLLRRGARSEFARSSAALLADWGAAAASLGLSAGILARGCASLTFSFECNPAEYAGVFLGTGVAGLLAAFLFTRIKDAAWSGWLAAVSAGFLTVAVFDAQAWTLSWWPLAALGVSLALRAGWGLLRESSPSAATHGRYAADTLAALAAALLLLLAPCFPTSMLLNSWGPAVGWMALVAYFLATSLGKREKETWRRGLGVALCAPALACMLYHLGFAFGAPAPWLAGLAASLLAGLAGYTSQAKRNFQVAAPIRAGIEAIALHAAGLALVLSYQGNHAPAALAYAFLALVPAVSAWSWRRKSGTIEHAILAETVALSLLAGVGLSAAAYISIHGLAWPLVLQLIAALVLLVSLVLERLTCPEYRSNPELGQDVATLEAGSKNPVALPYRSAGEAVALLLTFATCAQLLKATGLGRGAEQILLLTATWSAALVPLFIALRGSLARRSSTEPNLSEVTGVVLAAALASGAGLLALRAGFWNPACHSDLRTACALFFGAAWIISAGTGYYLRRSFAPVSGMFATLGLLGTAYGAWHLPVESFGLSCAMLTLGACGLAGLLRRKEGHAAGSPRTGQAAALDAAATGAGFLGVCHLLFGLTLWPTGPSHGFAVAAWAIFAWVAWRASRHARSGGRAGFATGLALAFAGCHAMRGAGLPFADFGAGLSGVALLLLGLREAVAWSMRAAEKEEAPADALAPAEAVQRLQAALHTPGPAEEHGRAKGLHRAAFVLAGAGLLFGMCESHLLHGWNWSVTLLESALFLAGYALATRNRRSGPSSAALWVGELGAWFLLACASHALAAAAGWPELFHGAGWALVGALFLLLGMAGEALAGAFAQWQGASAPSRTTHDASLPGPFLETRHMAALALGAYGVLHALHAPHALNLPALEQTWRALLGAAALAAYASMASWSVREAWRQAGRVLSSFAAYVVLLPAGYLCVLHAHSTGSPWGALWFLLLAPVLLAAAYVLEREHGVVQAQMARCGAVGVSLGALSLAFLKNPHRLPEVVCATLAALALQALITRAISGKREYTLAACLAGTGAFLFGLRAFAGFPAWGGEAWVWEWACLAAWGVLWIVLGGMGRWERGREGRSLVAQFGMALTGVALVAAFLQLMLLGTEARYLRLENQERLSAFIASLMLFSAAGLAARRWLGAVSGSAIAAATALLGYLLFIWTKHPVAWEWYTLPAAIFLFAWCREAVRNGLETRAGLRPALWAQEINTLLGAGCALALLPSTLQMLPFTPEALGHYFVLLAIGLALVGAAMLAHRKVPLMAGSGAVLLGTFLKTAQWAAHQEVFLPVLGIALGFAVLALGCLFESRMNRALREAMDRARAEARMFWVSWE